MNTIERVFFGNVLRTLREMSAAERQARAEELGDTIREHFPQDGAMCMDFCLAVYDVMDPDCAAAAPVRR